MSRRRAPPAVPAVPVEPPPVMRTSAAEPWPDEAGTVRGMMLNGVPVEFGFTPEDADPWFTLRPRLDGVLVAILVLDGAGRHLGTFGGVEAAIAYGWAQGGWGGERL